MLIDELELHLHPAWQQSVAKGLLELFPQTQFVVTTHSPLVVNDCEPGSLLLFQFDKQGKVVVDSSDTSMQGWLAEPIYAEIFNLSSTRNPEVEEQLKRYVQLYQKYLQEQAVGTAADADLLQRELLQLEQGLRMVLAPTDPALELLRFAELGKALKASGHG